MAKRNVHTGSRFDEFLKEEGIFEEVQARALKRALAEQLEDSMQAANLTKLDQEYHLDIQGHTANNSTDDNNYSLGKARAEVVKRYLHEKLGISINRMSTISYGANKPLNDSNGQNRRIFIRVLVLK